MAKIMVPYKIGMPFAFIFRFSFDICKFMVYLEKEANNANYSECHEYKTIIHHS
jgi:hypothetical protein